MEKIYSLTCVAAALSWCLIFPLTFVVWLIAEAEEDDKMKGELDLTGINDEELDMVAFLCLCNH